MPPPDSVEERCERIAAAWGTIRDDGGGIGRRKYLKQLHLLVLGKQELARFAPVGGMLPPVLHEAARMPVHLRTHEREPCVARGEGACRRTLEQLSHLKIVPFFLVLVCPVSSFAPSPGTDLANGAWPGAWGDKESA